MSTAAEITSAPLKRTTGFRAASFRHGQAGKRPRRST